MSSSFLVILATLALCNGHGILLRPISRAARLGNSVDDGLEFAGSCANQTCKWYTQKTFIPGKTTNCNPEARTMGVSCASKAPGPVDWPCTPGQAVPWCAPGSAPVKSPCGIFSGGYGNNGRDMLDLDDTPVGTWKAGEVQQVMWNIIANHGGGYAYRLCPADGDMSEECFQANQLKFANDTQLLVSKDGSVLQEINAVRVTEGTTPAGSVWTRNPIPMERGMTPIPNHPEIYGRGPFMFGVMDFVQVPKNLKSGQYTLSFRWDSEQVQQVWAQCGDIVITNDEEPRKAARPAPKKSAVRTKHTNICVGSSIGLDVDECDAWGEIYDALGGATWGSEQLRADPCTVTSFAKESWDIFIVCSAFRDAQHITELYLLGPEVVGVFPPAVTRLTKLGALSMATTNVSGHLPDNFGDALTELNMLWLDHNPKLLGPLPASFSKLNLSVLEMHYSGIGNTPLPTMPYRNITDCTLNGLVFKCPLPEGAETCGCSCQ